MNFTFVCASLDTTLSTKLLFYESELNSLLFVPLSDVIKGLAIFLRHCTDFVRPEHPYWAGGEDTTLEKNAGEISRKFSRYQFKSLPENVQSISKDIECILCN